MKIHAFTSPKNLTTKPGGLEGCMVELTLKHAYVYEVLEQKLSQFQNNDVITTSVHYLTIYSKRGIKYQRDPLQSTDLSPAVFVPFQVLNSLKALSTQCFFLIVREEILLMLFCSRIAL